jgi:hypothetical protein
MNLNLYFKNVNIHLAKLFKKNGYPNWYKAEDFKDIVEEGYISEDSAEDTAECLLEESIRLASNI